MLATKMSAAFYGRVVRAHNIRASIDANLKEALESGQYVLGGLA
jgi:hypothetical protein